MASNVDLIERQSRVLHERMRGVARRGEPYALLDFPNHSNVGDSAIWLGARRLLRNLYGYDPLYVGSTVGFDVDRFAKGFRGVVFLNGGGNLGDIWPSHQDLREALLRKLKGTTIVQLPQSIKFNDENRYDDMARLVEAHGRLHLFVRDEQSRRSAVAKLSCPVELVPDSAILNGPQSLRGIPRLRTLVFLRTDAEIGPMDRSDLHAIPDSAVVDWLDESESPRWTARRSVLFAMLRGHWRSNQRQIAMYDALARARFERGLKLLSSAKRVVTDRLHGHILSLLLGLPHVALDNSYGKVSGYIEAWTGDFDGLRRAETAQQVIDQLATLN